MYKSLAAWPMPQSTVTDHSSGPPPIIKIDPTAPIKVDITGSIPWPGFTYVTVNISPFLVCQTDMYSLVSIRPVTQHSPVSRTTVRLRQLRCASLLLLTGFRLMALLHLQQQRVPFPLAALFTDVT